ncbi:MAG: peptidase S41, partial [Bacteroidaceae bacterium]|nr:peptidase S41 [Bacteroidaceae bacterium]
GELSSADSIHFPDSLRYTTLRQQRTVYGGGGIMPDRFVPLDTTRFTRLHRELNARSYIINANLRYMDEHRDELHSLYPDFAAFERGFEVPRDVIDKMLADAEAKDKIRPRDDEELAKTIPTLSLILKGLVARDLWDMSEYFQVIYEQDPVVQEAVRIITNP